MTSQLAKEDIEALIDEGCVVHPSDVIRLNALGLKLEKRPDFRLATLPRVALCEGVMFIQPNIAQDMFLDQICQVFDKSPGTMLALEAYVLAHNDQSWDNMPRFPTIFALKCTHWIKKYLGKATADKVRNAIDYVKYGMNPADGEFPVYVTDETFEKWYFQNTAMSGALRDYMCACTLGIASDAAKAATSPQLKAMIERAYMLKENDISEDEKYLTAQYYKTLEEIKSKCKKTEVKNG